MTEKVGEMVKGQIGFVPCFIRFPGGTSNTVSKMYSPRILEHYKERGYRFEGISRDSYVVHHSVNN